MPPRQTPRNGMTDTWGRANRTISDRTCEACGEAFRPARSSARFCSRPCARTINGGHNKKAKTWWVNQRGYIEGRVWIGERQICVKQHRYVMEQHLGRPLSENEDVHHKDGDKQNNDIRNLVVLSHGEHSRITNAGRSYERGYNLDLSDDDRRARSDRAKAMGLSEMGRAVIAKAKGEPT